GAAECRQQRLRGNRACHGPRARVRVPHARGSRTRLRDGDGRERGRPHLRGARSGAVLGCGAEARATALRRTGTEIPLRTLHRSSNRLRYFRISAVIRSLGSYSWLRPTRCVAAKVKLEWQSPRQLSRLRCALCSDAALHLLLCCFWFSWSAIKTYPLAPACRSICLRSSSGHGTATTI